MLQISPDFVSRIGYHVTRKKLYIGKDSPRIVVLLAEQAFPVSSGCHRTPFTNNDVLLPSSYNSVPPAFSLVGVSSFAVASIHVYRRSYQRGVSS